MICYCKLFISDERLNSNYIHYIRDYIHIWSYVYHVRWSLMAYNVQRDTVFSSLGLYISWRNVIDEDLIYFDCLYVPMDVYYCIYTELFLVIHYPLLYFLCSRLMSLLPVTDIYLWNTCTSAAYFLSIHHLNLMTCLLILNIVLWPAPRGDHSSNYESDYQKSLSIKDYVPYY